MRGGQRRSLAAGAYEYRVLDEGLIDRDLFRGFTRTQTVTRSWRKERGEWLIRDNPFVDDWDEAAYAARIGLLKNAVRTGGLVAGFFDDGALKGFVSVEGTLFGSKNQYIELSSLHVSREARGCGLGRAMLEAAKAFARGKGARKLYISANSSVESIAFYRMMGCAEAEEYDPVITEREPCDCQIECPLYD